MSETDIHKAIYLTVLLYEGAWKGRVDEDATISLEKILLGNGTKEDYERLEEYGVTETEISKCS